MVIRLKVVAIKQEWYRGGENNPPSLNRDGGLFVFAAGSRVGIEMRSAYEITISGV